MSRVKAHIVNESESLITWLVISKNSFSTKHAPTEHMHRTAAVTVALAAGEHWRGHDGGACFGVGVFLLGRGLYKPAEMKRCLVFYPECTVRYCKIEPGRT